MKSVVVEQSTPAEAAAPVACPDPFRILKIATCPSLSGRSTLTYHIGCKRHGDSTEIGTPFIRVYANSAAGLFSNDWVALDVIQQSFADALSKLPLARAALSMRPKAAKGAPVHGVVLNMVDVRKQAYYGYGDAGYYYGKRAKYYTS